MGKSFVIVELLVKVKIINKYLGLDFIVKLSVGYICDFFVSGSGFMIDLKECVWQVVLICKMSLDEKVVYKKCKVRE